MKEMFNMNSSYIPISRNDGFELSARDTFPSSWSSRKPTNVSGQEPGTPHNSRRRRRWAWYILSHLVSLLWLGPITALLVLNYKKYIIGASVWCPGGRCSADPFGIDAVQKASELDRKDHNALGALQFVAKALEVWFMLIATTLVYDFAMLYARKGGGLPAGFFLTHLEFGDIRNLFNPLMWTAAFPLANSGPKRTSSTLKLYLFAILAAFLTILTNLMGPATAVLVLPTLQWIDMPYEPDQIFNGTNYGMYPVSDSAIPGCSAEQLAAGNYSCVYEIYGPSLETLADSGVSTEGSCTYILNVTKDQVLWTPNRQVLRALSRDFNEDILGLVASNRIYNNSLQTLLQRQGPSIGTRSICGFGNMTDHKVGKDKNVRCYKDWTLDSISFYTQCIRVGTGWSPKNTMTKFNLTNATSGGPTTAVSSFFSDKATLYNSTTDFGSGLNSCFKGGSLADCDWDKIFDTNLPKELSNTTTHVLMVEYDNTRAPTREARVWCESIAYIGFPTYTLNTSPSANPLRLVQLNNITELKNTSRPLVANPAWLLAAWSTDLNGLADAHRPIVKELNRILPAIYTSENDTELFQFLLLHHYTLSQSVSMVDYGFVNATLLNASLNPDLDRPLFSRYTTVRVWAYGISGRTSKLGVAVVFAGAACVLFRLFIGFVIRAHNQSSVEMFVAALEHQPQQEFRGLAGEREWAKVRYRLDTRVHGKPSFVPKRTT